MGSERGPPLVALRSREPRRLGRKAPVAHAVGNVRINRLRGGKVLGGAVGVPGTLLGHAAEVEGNGISRVELYRRIEILDRKVGLILEKVSAPTVAESIGEIRGELYRRIEILDGAVVLALGLISVASVEERPRKNSRRFLARLDQKRTATDAQVGIGIIAPSHDFIAGGRRRRGGEKITKERQKDPKAPLHRHLQSGSGA